VEKVSVIEGVAAPLMQPNIDTDTIIRIDRLMDFGRGELGPYCLEALRRRPDGTEEPGFVLNQPRFRSANILIAGDNFGCGSSREAAVWSLYDSGIRCIISCAFGDIFYTNCLQNGLLPVVLPATEVQMLAQEVQESSGARMSVDLLQRRVTSACGREIAFDIDAGQRAALLAGQDAISATLEFAPAIEAHHQEDRAKRPWMYPGQQKPAAVLMLAGDGIGAEIMTQVQRTAEWFMAKRGLPIELQSELYGISSWRQHGAVVTQQAWRSIHAADAILFGATGSPEYERIPREHWIPDNLLRIRSELGLFANLRPVVMYDALSANSSLKPEVVRHADLLIVRELAGGAYFGEPRGIQQDANGMRRAINTIVYTTPEIERIARVAFEQARVRSNRVCSVDKANVLEFGMLWREVVQKVHDEEFPDVELSHMYVDNAAMQLVRNPRQFDVLLTENLFGDILSDCAAMVAGSIGMLPSASLSGPDANGKRRALYEPIHGSAPDLEGKHLANPLGAIMSFGLCLQFSLNRPQEAQLLRRAVDRALSTGARTLDIAGSGPSVSTERMGDELIAALETLT
jgi:3-isopropylmalate dehydrogenase